MGLRERWHRLWKREPPKRTPLKPTPAQVQEFLQSYYVSLPEDVEMTEEERGAFMDALMEASMAYLAERETRGNS